MFGEDDETPPLHSPWLCSTSPSVRVKGVGKIGSLLELDEGFGSLDLNKGRGSLRPEVDAGHIEYKLKLLNPTPLRLAKLTTQLQFRIIEGSGHALYEIGVLDDGTLIGLSKVEMDASLHTLRLMLANLGGGEIRMMRVFLVGGEDREEEDDEDESGFEDFEVEEDDGEVYKGKEEILKERIESEGRSVQERDIVRTEKRLLRIARKEKEGQAKRVWNDVAVDYVRPVKINKPIKPQVVKDKSGAREIFKPSISMPMGEKRWVIEAMVIKREKEGEIEGWDFLNFEI